MSSKLVRILFLTPYPTGVAGSQRFRFEQYYDVLDRRGIDYEVMPFIGPAAWGILYKKGNTLKKVWYTIGGILRRFFLLFSLGKYHYIFIHRGSTVMGPPFFEWIASRLLDKKIIYDFDDAIWKLDISKANRFVSRFKQPQKVPKLIRWSHRVSAGNAYLAEYAAKLNRDVRVIPTVVDTKSYHNSLKDQSSSPVHIGWTGTHTTLRYLDPILPVLQKLERTFDFNFYVICNQPPEWQLNSLRYIEWNKDTEIEDLMKFHIGLMPLANDEWANGKCGFKAIQYMALGIVPVASAVGINRQIIKPGVNGILIESDDQWAEALSGLLTDAERRAEYGRKARTAIELKYSAHANEADFLALFEPGPE